jgi:cytochrome c biogenesis protein
MSTDETNGKTERSLTAKAWGLLTSLKLLIFLLLILAVMSIAGTIIEQDRPLQEYYRYFKPLTVQFFDKLGLFNMYHSWWFVSALALLALNISACTIDRYSGIMAGFRKNEPILDDILKKSLPFKEKITYALPLAEVEKKALAIAGAKFSKNYKITSDAQGNNHYFFEKGRYSRLAFFLTHLSILIIFLGGIIGSFFGYKGYVNILEGETISQLQTRSARIENLGFQVKCNTFDVEFYPTGEPKDYRSNLSILKNGKEVIRKTIRVNDPLSFEGITFFQSSYGAMPENVVIEAAKQDRTLLGSATALFGKRTAIHGITDIIEPADYHEHHVLPNGADAGPALGINVYSRNGQVMGVWLLINHPDYDKMRRGEYYFRVGKLDIKEYTGLQVNRDPGEILVWAGSLILIIGTMLAFFVSHKKLWISSRTDANGKSELTIAGTANRNREAMGRDMEEMIKGIKEISA